MNFKCCNNYNMINKNIMADKNIVLDDKLLELIFEQDTVEYLKKSDYTIQSGNIHKYTLQMLLSKECKEKRKIVSDLITKCYWDDNFLHTKEMIVTLVSGCTNKKSFRYNILYFLIQNDYPESIILKVLESNKIDLDIYDKNSNTLIHNVIFKKKYPNVFIKLLELSNSDIINKKNNRDLTCWDISTEIADSDFYLEKIISCGKFYFNEEFKKKNLEIIKEYCEDKNVIRNNKLYESDYKYIYKIYHYNKDLNLLNNYWKFYYDISLKYYFEDIYQIVTANKEKLEIILNFIKFIGWYCNFDKNFEIDLELFDLIDGNFMLSFTNKLLNYQDFYSGIQYILNNNDMNELIKSKNYVEDYLSCKFLIFDPKDIKNIEDIKNNYENYFNQLFLLKSIHDEKFCNKLIYLVLFHSLKNNVNIDIIKKYIKKIFVKFDNKSSRIFFKNHHETGEINREKELIPYLIHNYYCDDELVKMYLELGFFRQKYNFKPVKDDLFCKMIEVKMYDKVYELINDFNLDYYYYFFKPSRDFLSIFEYYLSIRETEKSYYIIKKTGSIIFNYISIHKVTGLDNNCFYEIAKKHNCKEIYPNDSALYWSCKNKMINIATFLLDNYLSDPNYTDSDGISVLSWACKNSLESIGLRLLDIENVDTSKLDFTNKSALNYAVENKLVKISEKLIEILIVLIEKNKIIKK